MIEILFGNEIEPTTGRKLYLAVEPAAPTIDGLSLAADVLTTITQTFLAKSTESLETALHAAFSVANDVVFAVNQAEGMVATENRILLGAVAVAVENETMVIAYVPPVQLVLVQDGELYAVPAFSIWEAATFSADRDESAVSLGAQSEIALEFITTNCSPSEVILLCSTALASCIELAGLRSGATATDLIPALLGSADTLNAGLDEIAAVLGEGRPLMASIYHIDGGEHWVWTAKIVEPIAPVVDEQQSTQSTDVEQTIDVRKEITPKRSTKWSGSWGRPTEAVVEQTVLADEIEQTAPGEPEQRALPRFLDQHAIDAGEATSSDESSRSRPKWLAYIPSREQLHNDVLNTSERLFGYDSPDDVKFEWNQRRSGIPGLRSIQVYQNSVVGPLPPELRARLPRGPRLRIPLRLLLPLLVFLVAFGGGGMFYNRYQAREDRVEQFLNKADAALAILQQTSDPVEAKSAIDTAQVALSAAEENGASAGTVSSRQKTIDTVSDQLNGIIRLQQITRIGTIPRNKDIKPQLLRVDRDLYLLDGGFYQLDMTNHRLIELLAPGDKIGNATVGALSTATLDGDIITLTDGKAVYFYDATQANWSRKRIGLVDGKTAWDINISGAFDGSFYILNRSGGQILKFSGDQLSSLPDNWASLDERATLRTAQDMVVDGRIYVLLEDGTVQPYYRGAPLDILSFGIQPALTSPQQLYGAFDTAFLYASDKGSKPGRIVRFGRQGGPVVQFLLPRSSESLSDEEEALPFSSIDNFVVDEVTNTIYILSGNQIWSATIPTVGAN